MCSSSQCAHIRSHHRNADAEILITTGDGKFYSNGLDLNWLGKFVGDKTKAQYFMSHYIRSLFQRIATFPMPTSGRNDSINNRLIGRLGESMIERFIID